MSTVEERHRQFVQTMLMDTYKVTRETQRLVKLGLQREEQQMADLDGIRADVAVIKQSQVDEKAAIQALADRLGDNPTEAEIAAIRSDLQAIAAEESAATEAINSLDPDLPGGSVPPEDEVPA